MTSIVEQRSVDRLVEILMALYRNGVVDRHQLMEQFAVNERTITRDLCALAPMVELCDDGRYRLAGAPAASVGHVLPPAQPLPAAARQTRRSPRRAALFTLRSPGPRRPSVARSVGQLPACCAAHRESVLFWLSAFTRRYPQWLHGRLIAVVSYYWSLAEERCRQTGRVTVKEI